MKRAWRREPSLRYLAGGFAALVIGLGVAALTEGVQRKTESIGKQLAKVKKHATEDGQRLNKTVITDFRGTGEKSYFLVFRSGAARRTRGQDERSRSQSDEVRILDVDEGKLVERLRFQPQGNYRFGFRAAGDVDGDGASELFGGWARLGGADAPGLGVTRPVPVAFSKADSGDKYRQDGLLRAPGRLEPELQAPEGAAARRIVRSYSEPLELVDVVDPNEMVSGYRAEETALAQRGQDARLVVAYLASAERSTSPKQIELRAWTFTFESGYPQLNRSCVVLGGPRRDREERIVLAPSRFVTVDRFIAARWAQLQKRAAC